MPHSLSILVVAYNEAPHIAQLKQAIDSLERPGDITVETILIDGGSCDKTVDCARTSGFDQVLVLPGASIPVCRNAGLKAATGDWIAFLDADCEPLPDWLEQAAFFLERETEAILGWPAQPPEPMTWVQAAWLFHWSHKNPSMDQRHGRAVVTQGGFRLVTTRNLVMHASVAVRLNGFNEDLPTGEDTDFAFRASQAGIPVWGVPALRAVHHGEPATLGAWFRQQLWHANRKSYRHILKLSGGKVGGNAPLFTALYLGTLIVGLVGLAGLVGQGHPAFAALLLPWPALILGPALRLCQRAGSWRFLPGLCILYAAYGLARVIDLLGLHPAKPSWKGRPKTSRGTTGL